MKTTKQKESFEDESIISPARRIFYIDVGDMPTYYVMACVEAIKELADGL